MVVVEGVGVESLSGRHGLGGGQAPADCLYGTAEVPPTGVGFCAEHHPGYRDDVPAC